MTNKIDKIQMPDGQVLELGGGGLEVCDIGMALYVDETKGLRRYLNGQIVDINTNTQAFLNRLKEITTLHPSLLCTEEEWQTAKTMSAFGQVGKFVFNYSGNEIVSVRIPRVVNVQGLFDLQNLGMTVEAGLPNITGTVGSDHSDYWSGAFYSDGTSYSGNMGSGTDEKALFDASRSSSVYGNSDTVQPEAIQYPYFIQIATGSETENNIINEIELNNPYSLFDSKYSDNELNNLSWLKSEGQWNAKAVYPSAYDELLREYNNPDRLATFNKDVFEVVGSPVISADGVYTNTDSAQYLQIPCDFLTDRFTLEMSLNVEQFTDSSAGIFGEGYLLGGGDIAGNGIINTFWNGSGATDVRIYTSGNNKISTALSTGKELGKYKLIYDYNNGSLTMTLITPSGIKRQSTVTSEYTGLSNYKYIRIAYFKGGSIDLKQFSITVDGVKVFSGAKSKVKLSTEEYTDYDFVLNTSEETFRLPLKTKLASGKAVVGNGMTLGLTDGSSYSGTGTGGSGTLVQMNNYGANIGTSQTEGVPLAVAKVIGITTDPTKSGIELSDSGLYLYYYIGETVQNANLIDAGRIGEVLATKTDMLQASGAGMPSNKYIDLTLGASGSTYTAPANGYYLLSKYAPAQVQNIAIRKFGEIWVLEWAPVAQINLFCWVPVTKGETISITYTATGATNYFRFYYAEGEV